MRILSRESAPAIPLERRHCATHRKNEELVLTPSPEDRAHRNDSTPGCELDLSVVIVTWNSERWIGRCLETLARACRGLPHEILVCDNGSTDRTLEIAARSRPDEELVILASAENRGFARGVNEAVEVARGRYILLLNPDTEVEEDAVGLLIAAADEERADALVPLLTDMAGVPQHDFQLRRLPDLRSIAANLLLLERVFPANSLTASARYSAGELVRLSPVEQPAAAAMLLRREVFSRVGPLDERFSPAWFEDVDFCRRLRDAGIRVLLLPDARVLHAGGASLEHVPAGAFLSIWYRNQFRYVEKWFSPGETELVRWMIIAGSVMRAVASLGGLSMRGLSRPAAARAYLRVAREAFHRWPMSSASS